jgi:hypothetical protein
VVLGFVSGHGAISFAECNAKGVPDTVFLQPQRPRLGATSGRRLWADLLSVSRRTDAIGIFRAACR